MMFIKGTKIIESPMLCDETKYYQFRKTRGKKKRIREKLFFNKRNLRTKIIKPGMLHDTKNNILFVSSEDYQKIKIECIN